MIIITSSAFMSSIILTAHSMQMDVKEVDVDSVVMFLSLDDARSKIEAWRTDFNETRPHTSLGFMTPAEFASSAGVNPGR